MLFSLSFFMHMLTFTSNFGNTTGFLMAGTAALLALTGIANDMLCEKRGLRMITFNFAHMHFVTI